MTTTDSTGAVQTQFDQPPSGSTPMKRPWGRWEWLYVVAAAASIASAVFGRFEAYAICKPLPLLTALAWVACNRTPVAGLAVPQRWLLLGLLASLAGDVLLLFPGHFVSGLVAFLLAHVAYTALFGWRAGWMPRPQLLLSTLLVGLAMYAFLWVGGLPSALRGPVAAYVLVIACMAGQALGRAALWRDTAARHVALGACVFMLSDALLATNRFVTPLPLAPVWVLGTYYVAQFLIARHTGPRHS